MNIVLESPDVLFSFNRRNLLHLLAAVAAAKSLQSCPTLCYSIDGSPPGSSVPGILQARILEWVAISVSIILLKVGLYHCHILSMAIENEGWCFSLLNMDFQEFVILIYNFNFIPPFV